MKDETIIRARTFRYPDGESDIKRLIRLDGKWYNLDHVKSQPPIPDEYIGVHLISESWPGDSAINDLPGVVRGIEDRLLGSEVLPTEIGRRNYPPDGYYTANWDNVPCTCRFEECLKSCKGGCGCKACSDAYGDYLSSQGD